MDGPDECFGSRKGKVVLALCHWTLRHFQEKECPWLSISPVFLPHGLRASHHGFSTNYVKFHFEFPKTHSLFIKQTITDTSYCLPECSQLLTICRLLLACLEWAGKLRGFSVLVWEMERIQFLVVKKGWGGEKEKHQKLGNDSSYHWEKHWPGSLDFGFMNRLVKDSDSIRAPIPLASCFTLIYSHHFKKGRSGSLREG